MYDSWIRYVCERHGCITQHLHKVARMDSGDWNREVIRWPFAQDSLATCDWKPLSYILYSLSVIIISGELAIQEPKMSATITGKAPMYYHSDMVYCSFVLLSVWLGREKREGESMAKPSGQYRCTTTITSSYLTSSLTEVKLFMVEVYGLWLMSMLENT